MPIKYRHKYILYELISLELKETVESLKKLIILCIDVKI